ncbi:MAG: SCP2 sterol-binding domain-containing protein [Proteobacteria bacterium]|nr:SCP2 sterol-binding domain-containing protein [Pseudomonadota bacterium]
MALAPPPRFVLQAAVDGAARIVTRRHRALVERLGSLAGTTFLIDPEDLPFRFVLRPDPRRLRLEVVGRRRTPCCDATIRGPLWSLVGLVEGRVDGDALFFSRELHISGDTEAIVALRNIIDGAELDLFSDFASGLGVFSGPAEHILRRLAAAAQPRHRAADGAR